MIGLLVLAVLMSAGRAGRAGAAPSLLLPVAADGVVDDNVPVKADTPPAVEAAAPALSHGFGGAALLVVAIVCWC